MFWNKNKIEAKLKSKKKELDLVNLKLKEKEQENRIGTLKLKELKRIIKHNKLKPVEAYKNEVPSNHRNSRNKINIDETKIQAISKTYEASNKEGQIDTQPIVNQKVVPLQLATLEWKSKANNKSLHESMVDLRKEQSEEFYKDEDIINDYGGDKDIDVKSKSRHSIFNFNDIY